MSIKEKVNGYIKSIANQVFDERQPEREEFVGAVFRLITVNDVSTLTDIASEKVKFFKNH